MLNKVLKLIFFVVIAFLLVSCSIGGGSSNEESSGGLSFTFDRSYPSGTEIVVSVVDDRIGVIKEQLKQSYDPNQSHYKANIASYEYGYYIRAFVVLNDIDGITLASCDGGLNIPGGLYVSNSAPVIEIFAESDIVVLPNHEIGRVSIEFNDHNEYFDIMGIFQDVDLAINYPSMVVSYKFLEKPAGSSLSEADINFTQYVANKNYISTSTRLTPDVGGVYKIEFKCFDGVQSSTKILTITVPKAGEGVLDVSIG